MKDEFKNVFLDMLDKKNEVQSGNKSESQKNNNSAIQNARKNSVKSESGSSSEEEEVDVNIHEFQNAANRMLVDKNIVRRPSI